MDPDRIDVIPNWTDTERIRPVARADNPLFAELGLDPGGFYVVYAGALGILQNPEIIGSAASLLSGSGVFFCRFLRRNL